MLQHFNEATRIESVSVCVCVCVRIERQYTIEMSRRKRKEIEEIGNECTRYERTDKNKASAQRFWAEDNEEFIATQNGMVKLRARNDAQIN